MTQEQHIDRQALMDKSYSQLSDRPKQYEDDLLRRIQKDKIRHQLFEETSHLDKDTNREHYENALLSKVMESLVGDDSHQSMFNRQDTQTEMLMITSAVALTDEEKEKIVRKFMAKTNKKLRRVTTVVDPSLITGVRLQSESFYYEVSGQKTLRDLKRHLDSSWHL